MPESFNLPAAKNAPSLKNLCSRSRDLNFSSLCPTQYPVVNHDSAHFPERFLVKCYMASGWAASLLAIHSIRKLDLCRSVHDITSALTEIELAWYAATVLAS